MPPIAQTLDKGPFMSDPHLLNMTHFGEESGMPLLIVHGLFGSGRNWRAIARHLAKDRHVVTVDLRNHGNSFWDEDNTYPALARDLARVISHLGGQADVLGHSMGGKAAMVLALEYPRMINRLIIADIAPLGYAHTQSDNIAIMQSIPLQGLARRSAAQSELEEKTGDAGLSAFFAQSIDVEDGNLRWLLNLDALDRNMQPIIGFPHMPGTFPTDTLFIRGGDSDYVDGTGETEIMRLFPNATIRTIDGAGHWLHADKPREFMTILSEYLAG